MVNDVDGTNLNAPIGIDWQSRELEIPDDLGAFGVMSDEKARTIRFVANRYYKGEDMSTYKYRINYMNEEGISDIYQVDDVEVEPYTIAFDWVLSRLATAVSGLTQFSVCGLKFAKDGKTVANEVNSQIETFVVFNCLEVEESAEAIERLDWLQSYLTKIESTFTTIESISIAYAASSSQTSTPSSWSSSVPTLTAGQWLWTRFTIAFNQGADKILYFKSYQGQDGNVLQNEQIAALEEKIATINAKNASQDERMTAIEAVDKRQDTDIVTLAINNCTSGLLVNGVWYTHGLEVEGNTIAVEDASLSGSQWVLPVKHCVADEALEVAQGAVDVNINQESRLLVLEKWKPTVDDEITAEKADRAKLWAAIHTLAMNCGTYPFLIDTTYHSAGYC